MHKPWKIMLFGAIAFSGCKVEESNFSKSLSSSLLVNDLYGKYHVNEDGKIMDGEKVIRIKGVNWFGLEGRHELESDPNNPSGAPMELFLNDMFWHQPDPSPVILRDKQARVEHIKKIMKKAKDDIGFNTIRFPLAPQTLDRDDRQGTDMQIMKNKHKMKAYDAMIAFIEAARELNLYVLMDIHSCSNYLGWRAGRLDATPPYSDANRSDSLYHDKREDYDCTSTHPYGEDKWIKNLREIAQISKKYENIIGIDLFNEPHDYTWTEWSQLASKAYKEVHKVNEDLLVFVEGVAGKSPHGIAEINPNWGENLFEALTREGELNIDIPKQKLVFAPHAYGPAVYVQKHFLNVEGNHPDCIPDLESSTGGGWDEELIGKHKCQMKMDPELLEKGWEEHFGFLASKGYAVVIGEFGGFLNFPGGPTAPWKQEWAQHIRPEDRHEYQWQKAFVDYLCHKGIDAFYWSLNPESGDTGGLYNSDWHPVTNPTDWGLWGSVNQEKHALLSKLWTCHSEPGPTEPDDENIPPTSSDLSIKTEKNTPVKIYLKGRDTDGRIVQFELVTQPQSGSASLNGSIVTYTPQAGFTGTDFFKYRSIDDSGAQSTPATVSITVSKKTQDDDEIKVSCSLGTPQVWNSGFVYDKITITNTSNSEITNWKTHIRFSNKITLVNSWSGNFTILPDGKELIIENAPYNGNLRAGESTTFGFEGGFTGIFQAPECQESF